MALDIFGPIIKDDEPGGGTQPTVVERIERLNQPIKQYTAENIAVNLNVYTGKPTITHTDMCVGAGNYQIPVSHVYRDDLVGISAPVTIGFGDGWKLNLHQYVYPYQASYNYAGFSSGDYVYIDDVGYKHRFVKYKTEDGFDVYYDADGTGLSLKLLADNECEVYNDVTRLHFDESGRLDKIVSPFNAILDKVIVYENDKITKAYVSGKSSRELQFTYLNGCLDEIKCAGHANTLKFTYDTTSLKLTSVDLVNGDTSKNIATYAYSGNKIALAYDSRKNQGVKLSYNSNRVSSVKTGVVADANISTQLNYDQYTYATGANKTEVTNEKSITLAYNFDLNGKLCGVFEKDVSGSVTKYRTLQKATGWSLSTDSPSSVIETINGKTNDYVTTSLAINSERVSAFKGIFGVDENGNDKPHKYTDRFTLSFWLKTTTDTTGPATASLTVSTVNGAHDTTHSIKLRNLRKDAWQYVTIPVYFDKPDTNGNYPSNETILARKENITGMTIGFGSLTNVYVSDMRITVGAPAKIMVDDVEFKDQAIACITSGFDYTVLSDSFMTESDLYTTFKNKYLAIGNEFDLVYCNGTKVKQVYDFGFEKATGVIIPFTIAMQSLPELNQIDTPNYFIQSKTRIAENKWTVSETRYKYYYVYKDSVTDVIINKSHYEEKQSIGQVESISANLPDSASYKYVQVYGNGLQREQRDEYGLITKYTHDNYGNLEKTEAYFESAADGKKITTVYDYDAGHEYATNITVSDATQTPSKTTTYQLNYVDAPYINVSQIKTDYEVAENFTYSNDLTQLIKVNKTVEVEIEDEQPDGGISEDFVGNGTRTVEILKNDLTYNGNSGRLNSVSDQGGRQYTFGYNEFGELTTCWRNGVKIEESTITRSTSNDNITKMSYYSSTPHQIVTTLDKYGRVKNTIGEQLVVYTYEDELPVTTFKESPYCAQISKIADRHTGDTYEYSYDSESGKLNSYTVKDSNGDKKIVVTEEPNKVIQIDVDGEPVQISGNAKVYSINNSSETRESFVKYDNQNEKVFEPRIAITKDSYKEVNSVIASYSYDALGRNKKIIYDGKTSDILQRGFIKSETELTYNGYTNKPTELKEVTELENQSKTRFNIAVTYDSKGNISSNQLSTNVYYYPDSTYPQVDLNNTTVKKLVSYSYDDCNRLIEESNSVLGNFKYNYDTKGNLFSVEKLNSNGAYDVIKTFTYDANGRKVAINTDDNIVYDDYGNITSIGPKSTYAYNIMGLMQTAQHVKDGTTYTSSNTYNHQGVRCSKTVSVVGGETITKTYILDGNKILGEDWVCENTANPLNTAKLHYLYDARGVCAIICNGCLYQLSRDVDGSIIRISHNGRPLCEYHYDAW
ncbi:MAG: hypothetical protein IJB13_05460, partial [Clostridia bacterium]|nr:hypothetical protein [Clostridia bacterium]